ncbi:hypothetical protein ACFVIM_30705 [Streptomyces sp. NPDC057638]|uniref:hypothetical protein n=1 Tax=Streptomyces sp. NPDC057638 TaxID=3346190 RepID=UPI003691DFD2
MNRRHTLWDPPPTLTPSSLEGLAVLGHAHGPTHPPWTRRGKSRTRYSIHALDADRDRLLVSISSIVLADGDTEHPHPQRGITGWAKPGDFELILLSHLRTEGPYSGYQCHHHTATHPGARPCWHCKARPPGDSCDHFTVARSVLGENPAGGAR